MHVEIAWSRETDTGVVDVEGCEKKIFIFHFLNQESEK